MTKHEAGEAPRKHTCPECKTEFKCGSCQAEDSNNEIICAPCEWKLYGPKE